MNAPLMTPFLFEDQSLVRVISHGEAPWFVAADVCKVLGLVHTGSALRSLHEDEKGVHNAHTLGGCQEMTVISESGLYALIFRSRKPEAQRFRKWVTAEVIPSIRRTGSYSVRPANDEKAELAARRLRLLERNAAVRMVDQIKRTHGAKAAADSLPGIYAAVGVQVNLRRAEVQPELPLQMPPANDAKKRDEDAA